MTSQMLESVVAEPLVEPLEPAPSAVSVFGKLWGRRHCLFLDSALADRHLGRYSFVAVDPFDFVRMSADRRDALTELEGRLRAMRSWHVPDLPPFQGGAAGLLSYDLGRSFEQLPRPRWDEFGMPALAVGLYDVVVAFDHQMDRAWIISQGLPETEPARRRRRAAQRLGQMKAWLEQPEAPPPPCSRALCLDPLAPQYAVDGPPGLTSNFTRERYLEAIERAIDYVYAGDVFQVNLAQRLLYPASDSSVNLYLRLRQRNAATFAGYFDLGEFQILSASPERFLSVRQRQVQARPIKGTRQRIRMPEADLYAAHDMEQSEKDRAENVMIVDLLRNDISRVCEPESVCVSQLCQVEVYQYVQHLVSAVEGRLNDQATALDLVRTAFPGGSVTGAPKVRAMQIIAELEPTARGAYCGSLGYMGFDGNMDLNILIRTVTAGRGWWQMPAGGGIVAQSVPEREYEETWHKAEGFLRSLA